MMRLPAPPNKGFLPTRGAQRTHSRQKHQSFGAFVAGRQDELSTFAYSVVADCDAPPPGGGA